ncbi:MAG: Hpt domain-containing protein [Rhodobacteraceae bacterium]|nr:Hpt domain-containing protein [Paracoccaceae bacterium]
MTTILDSDSLAALLGCGDSTVVAALLEQMMSDFARLHDQGVVLMASLGAQADTDFSALRRLAHEAKGLALTIGAHKLTQICAEAEVLAQKGDRDALSQCWADMIGLCSDARVELAQNRMRV